MISVSINLFRDIFPVSMKTVRIQTAQDVEMIQHPRETWYLSLIHICSIGEVTVEKIGKSAVFFGGGGTTFYVKNRIIKLFPKFIDFEKKI